MIDFLIDVGKVALVILLGALGGGLLILFFLVGGIMALVGEGSWLVPVLGLLGGCFFLVLMPRAVDL